MHSSKLVIGMPTEMIEYGHQIEQKVKAMQNEIKAYREPTVKGRKPGQINNLEQKEEINIQPEQNEETKIQKNEERLRIFQDIFKCPSIWIIGVPEGKKEEQEIENLCENIMKENFPKMAKEIDFQEVQETWIVPKIWTQGSTHQSTS